MISWQPCRRIEFSYGIEPIVCLRARRGLSGVVNLPPANRASFRLLVSGAPKNAAGTRYLRSVFRQTPASREFGQQRICFHLRIGAVVLCDGSAQLAEGKIWLTAERVPCGKQVFRKRVVGLPSMPNAPVALPRPPFAGGRCRRHGSSNLPAVNGRRRQGLQFLKCFILLALAKKNFDSPAFSIFGA